MRQQEYRFFPAENSPRCVARTSNSKQNYNLRKFFYKRLWTAHLWGPSFRFSKQKPITLEWDQSIRYCVQNLDELFRILSDAGRLFFPFPIFVLSPWRSFEWDTFRSTVSSLTLPPKPNYRHWTESKQELRWVRSFVMSCRHRVRVIEFDSVHM